MRTSARLARVGVAGAAVAVACAALVAAQAQTDQPAATFKAGVELVTVDVSVSDRNGQPVRDLLAADFTVKVDGKLRRVVSAQHVHFDVDAARKAAVQQAGEETFFTSNIGPPEGRMIILAVDQSNIRPGAVRQLLRTAAAFVDRLGPADQVAFVAFPPPGPEVNFTTDRVRLKAAMEQVVGNQQDFSGRFNIGLFEAIAIAERFDEIVLRQVADRECASVRGAELQECQREVRNEAGGRARFARQEANQALSALNNLLRRLAVLDGTKAMVLISEGLVLDDLGGSSEEVARLAAMARTSMNVLLMDVTQNDVSTIELPPTPSQDRALQTSGLEALATSARGVLTRVFGQGEQAFNRLSSELSGHYVLGIEQAAGDLDGKRHRLDVSIRRRGLTLRSHRAFVTASTDARGASPQDRLVEALGSPFAVSDLPLRVTNFSFQDAQDPARVRVLVSAEVGQAGTAAGEYTVGFVMFGPDGRAVASTTRKEMLTPVDGQPDAPLEYQFATVVDPGVYTLRFGVVDAQGRRGSVVRDIRAWKIDGVEFTAGDLLVGNVPSAPGELSRPQVEPRVHQRRMNAYLEIYGATQAALDGTSVSLEVADDVDEPALTTTPVRFFRGAQPTTVIAAAEVGTDALPPGRYVARARIERGGKPAGLLLRPFIVQPAGSGPLPPAHLTAWVPAFTRDSVLAPAVVTEMLTLAVGRSAVLADALAEARAGRYGTAALDALTAGEQTVAAFLKGLDFYVKGQLDQAATQFTTAAGPRREF
ncbi:MAG: VWA domain-containing protein, partial [Vicinamibacterales bacterium]